MDKDRKNIRILFMIGLLIVGFQNCSGVAFLPPSKNIGSAEILAVDDTTPLVKTPGVVTILLALGDQLDGELVVKGGSSQLIAETMVRYASPVVNPKILVVRDLANHSETAYDSEFIANTLLVRYNASFMDEPAGGLTANDLRGFDLIWFNNPGWPMGRSQSKMALMAFNGGIIISGDDMSRGVEFSMSDLTGLTFIDNGTSFSCGNQTYQSDNNASNKYLVSIAAGKIPESAADQLHFSYGNDIDNTRVIDSSKVEVIATAVGDKSNCTESRPAIVRYVRTMN